VRLPISPFGVLLVTLTAFLVSPEAEGRAPEPQRGPCRTQPYPGEGVSAIPHEYFYTRGIYQGTRCGNWTIDYPKSDRQFLVGVRRLTNLDAYEAEHPVRLDNPDLNRFPFLYMVEVGHADFTESEVAGLRRYLLAGGFLVADDFWGSYEWANWEYQIGRVLPEYKIVELSLDNPIFHGMYDVKDIRQVPNVNNGCYGNGRYWEQDGYEPHVRGIFDDQHRLLVVINWNSDLGDAWEWAEQPCYPLDRSTYAWEMGINYIIYGMSH